MVLKVYRGLRWIYTLAHFAKQTFCVPVTQSLIITEDVTDSKSQNLADANLRDTVPLGFQT